MNRKTEDPQIERLNAVFQRVVEVDVALRSEVLKSECAGDQRLQDQVTKLLAADEDTDPFLDSGGVVSEVLDAGLPKRGDRFGKFVLGDEVGRGGMGIVFRADQVEPFCRRVAIKFLNGISLTSEGRARFEAEKHALAALEHQNVTRIYDAGITESGIGYIAMEYVAGIPLTNYCLTHALTTRQRIELFQQVCRAVDYLHHKEIIHRDIKPSNILVEKKGDLHVPKLIDFGVAKITSPTDTKGPATRTGFMIGTPQYMSPEQAVMRDGIQPDERGDVYSLGITLYELLIGRPPIEYDPASDSLLDVLQSIRDGDIRVPSLSLKQDGSLHRDQQEKIQTLTRDLRSGLDAVVMKAIEVDPDCRYQTPVQLSDDIQQFLDGKPVAASLPGWFQHTSKWINRHRVLAVASGIFTIVCSLLLIMATIARSNAASERQARAIIQSHIDEVDRNRAIFRESQREFEEQIIAGYQQADADSMQGFSGMFPMMGGPEGEMSDSDPMLALSLGLRNISPWLSWNERASALPLLTIPFSSTPALGQQNTGSSSGFLGSLFGAMIKLDTVPGMDNIPAEAFEQTVEFTEILLKNQQAALNKDSMILFDSCVIMAQIYLLADLPKEALELCDQSMSIELPGDQNARRLLSEVLRLAAQVEVDGMDRASLKPLNKEFDRSIAKLENEKNRLLLMSVFSNLKTRMRKHARR